MIDQLILVRHGETVLNVAGIAQGWNDSALSETGQRQALALAERLKSQGVTAIFSSPLGRARTTAEVLAAAIGLPVATLPDLREMCYGEWEGMRFLDVRAQYPDDYVKWIDDADYPCPGGESHRDLLQRMEQAFVHVGVPLYPPSGAESGAQAGVPAGLRSSGKAAESAPSAQDQSASPQNEERQRIVLVTHGTAIRVGATALLGAPLSTARHLAQDNASFNLFIRRGDRLVLKVWNDTTHCER
jgi:broad specificity phosphatase PhoE